MLSKDLTPKAAVQILRAKGFTFSQISELLNKPPNYACRLFSEEIKNPSYQIVDALRRLAKEKRPMEK